MGTHHSIGQIEHALRESDGNISVAARALGVQRSTIYRRINDSPTLQQALDDAREELVDIAESATRTAAEKGEAWANIWILKASPAAKKRGWSERQEVTGADGEPILIRMDR